MTMYRVMMKKILNNVLFIVCTTMFMLIAKHTMSYSNYGFWGSVSLTFITVSFGAILCRIFMNNTLGNARDIDKTIFRPYQIDINTSISCAEFMMYRDAKSFVSGSHYYDDDLKSGLGLTQQMSIDFDKMNKIVLSCDSKDSDNLLTIKRNDLLKLIRSKYVSCLGLQNYVKTKQNKDGLNDKEMSLLIMRILSNTNGIDFYEKIAPFDMKIFQCGTQSMIRVLDAYEMYLKNHIDEDVLDLHTPRVFNLGIKKKNLKENYI